MGEIIKIKPNETDQCVHHWIIGDSKGGVALGTCKKCKATKEFNTLWGATTNWRKKKPDAK